MTILKTIALIALWAACCLITLAIIVGGMIGRDGIQGYDVAFGSACFLLACTAAFSILNHENRRHR